ncbi:MAG: hypothetical protein EAX96_19950 [Candidatus Lokiarchaeota archaeon]|nr:hypothetical protein [Candidatus Lokiarchaeota archaeon]
MKENDKTFLKKLIKDSALECMMEFNDARVPIYFIANRLNKEENIVRELFQEMILNKEFSGEYDPDGDFIIYKRPLPKCYSCGVPMDEREKKCNNCGLELRLCMLCKKYIREVPAICPKCKSAAHEDHFRDWLRMDMNKETGKGSCPVCGVPLHPSDIMKEDDLYKSYFSF